MLPSSVRAYGCVPTANDGPLLGVWGAVSVPVDGDPGATVGGLAAVSGRGVSSTVTVSMVVVVGGVAGESRGHKRLLIRLPYREKLIAFASFISSPSISQLWPTHFILCLLNEFIIRCRTPLPISEITPLLAREAMGACCAGLGGTVSEVLACK